jgi:hypothetical protein
MPATTRNQTTISGKLRQPKTNQKRGRLRCHKRPKSREETPKKGIGGKRLAAPQQYERAVHKKQEVCPIFFGNLDGL